MRSRWFPEVLLVACGCSIVPASDGETQGSGSESTETGSIVDKTDGESTSTSDGEGGTDEGETGGGASFGDSPWTETPPDCVHESGVLLVDSTLGRAWVIEGGQEIELAVTGEASSGTAAGDWVAVSSRSTGVGPSDTVAVFARHSGELSWSRESPIRWGSLSEDGQTIAETIWDEDPVPSSSGTTWLTSADYSYALGGTLLIAGPASGYVAVTHVDLGDIWLEDGWHGLEGQGWHPTMPATELFVSPGEDGYTLYYTLWLDEPRRFVRARVDESKTMILPPGGQGFDRVGDYLFESYGDCQHYYRHDIETGESLAIDIEPPPGWTMPCRGEADSEGAAMYFVLTSGDSRQLWVYDIEDATWEPLGEPFPSCSGDDLVDIYWLSDDIVVLETRCHPPEENSTYHLFRRDPPLSLTIVSSQYSTPVHASLRIDSQQQCVALMGDDDDWEVWTLDGSEEVFHTGHSCYGSSFVWLD